jgi:hypothetical protein
MNYLKLILFVFIFSSCTNVADKNEVGNQDSGNGIISKNDTTLSLNAEALKTYEAFKKRWGVIDTPTKIILLDIFKQQQDSINYSKDMLSIIIEDYLFNSDTGLNNSIENLVMFNYYWKTERMSFISNYLEKYKYWLFADTIDIYKRLKLYKIQLIIRGNYYDNLTNFDYNYYIDIKSNKQTKNLSCNEIEKQISNYLMSELNNFDLELFILTNKNSIRKNYACISKYLMKQSDSNLSKIKYCKLNYLSLEIGVIDKDKFEEQLSYRKKITRKFNLAQN